MQSIKILSISIFIIFLMTCASCAEETSSQIKNLEVSPATIEKRLPSYSKSLKQLNKKAEENINEIDSILKAQEEEKEVMQHVEEGTRLCRSGQIKEAKKEWRTAYKMTKNRKLRDYIRKTQRYEIKAYREKLRNQSQAERDAAKAERQRLEEERRQEAKKEKEKALNDRVKAARLYKEAVRLYKSKDYQAARDKFEEVADLRPGYARTKYYIRSCDYVINKTK